MAYIITSGIAGYQPLAETSTTARHPLGTVVVGSDATLGGGEFIYLLGVASTVIGSVVTYGISTYQTTLAAVGTGLPQSIAFAMSANVAAQYGWYQISGIAVAKKSLATSLATGIAVGVKTTGLVSSSGSLKEIQGALVAAVSSAKSSSSLTTVNLMINRPRLQGRIT